MSTVPVMSNSDVRMTRPHVETAGTAPGVGVVAIIYVTAKYGCRLSCGASLPVDVVGCIVTSHSS